MKIKLKKIIIALLMACLTCVTMTATPTLASDETDTQDWQLTLKQGKSFFTVPFENDEPWNSVYKAQYKVKKATSLNPSVAKVSVWKKYWVNISGVAPGTTTLTIACSNNKMTNIKVNVTAKNLIASTTLTKFAPVYPTPIKYFDYVGQSEYNGVIKDEYRVKAKYAICKQKISGMQPGDIYCVRYGETPSTLPNASTSDAYLVNVVSTDTYCMNFINNYRPSSDSFKGKYIDNLCKALTRNPDNKRPRLKASLYHGGEIRQVDPDSDGGGYGGPAYNSYGATSQINVPYSCGFLKDLPESSYDCNYGYGTWLNNRLEILSDYWSKNKTLYSVNSPFFYDNSNVAYTGRIKDFVESYITDKNAVYISKSGAKLVETSAIDVQQYYDTTHFCQIVHFLDCHF